MSPNTTFPFARSPENAITHLVLQHPRVTYDVDCGALVIALRDELLVRASARQGSPELDKALESVADNAGCIDAGTRQTPGAAQRTEIWRLRDPSADSIDEARRLRELAPIDHIKTRRGPAVAVAAVTPNHVCVVSWKFDCCPAGPPIPTTAPESGEGFVKSLEGEPQATVVLIDTGYIPTGPQHPPHAALDARVSSVNGVWFNSAAPPGWTACSADQLDADHDHRLDGIAGHGTFNAGLIAHGCPEAQVIVVGQRHDCMPIGDPIDAKMLFSAESDIANAVQAHPDADVIACGFAFPTLDGFASTPFASVMQFLTGPDAPRPGVAIVAPAGNEESAQPYWPAAHPDVIGVAATNIAENGRAYFSNWGRWANCCARGQAVPSTYVYWEGPVDGEPGSPVNIFAGWAVWDGTSFAAPKVAAAIAQRVVDSGRTVTPVDAFAELIAGTVAGVAVTQIHAELPHSPGVVGLPCLRLG